MSDGATQPMRRDAVRNRDRLLTAARQLFAERGQDVALEEIARMAGVSRTTIYRNFATREELAAAVFEDNAARIERHAAALRDHPDAVVRLLDFVLDMQLENRGMAQLLSSADLAWLTGIVSRIAAAFASLLDQGQAAGVVLPGVETEDLMVAVSMHESVTAAGDPVQREERSKRVRGILHRGLFNESPI
jgi:AcrR family transcriptional regulator